MHLLLFDGIFLTLRQRGVTVFMPHACAKAQVFVTKSH